MTTEVMEAPSAPEQEVHNEIEPVEESQTFAEFNEFNETDDSDDDAPVPPEKETLIDEIASEFVGFWNALVSNTNWEKGKVIHSWRMRLKEAGLPRRIYSDEALSTRIGNVTPQHVGRLRRVYERFGAEPMLPNLFWSHYQAALDWDDADEWLQKASEGKISVAQMRMDRWEKTGASLKSKPKEEDIVPAERDEDVNPYNDSDADAPIRSKTAETTEVDEPTGEKKKKGKEKKSDELGEFASETEPWESPDGATAKITTAEALDAYAKLPTLPNDLAEIFESLKVAILTRKLENWNDVTPITLAQYFSELKKLLVSVEE